MRTSWNHAGAENIRSCFSTMESAPHQHCALHGAETTPPHVSTRHLLPHLSALPHRNFPINKTIKWIVFKVIRYFMIKLRIKLTLVLEHRSFSASACFYSLSRGILIPPCVWTRASAGSSRRGGTNRAKFGSCRNGAAAQWEGRNQGRLVLPPMHFLFASLKVLHLQSGQRHETCCETDFPASSHLFADTRWAGPVQTRTFSKLDVFRETRSFRICASASWRVRWRFQKVWILQLMAKICEIIFCLKTFQRT